MKKLFLSLSALVMAAAPAVYADTLEAGTADAPKYYTISASRGNYRYLAYDPSGIILTTTIPSTEEVGEATQLQCTTHLVRNNAVDLYGVWTVTAGTAANTFVIKNVMGDAYLMGFQTKAGEPSDAPNGIATTVSEPTDIYVKDTGDGTYMPSLYNANGYTYNPAVDGEFAFHGLDAPVGDVRYCGNYWSGDGVKWTFTAYDADAYKAEAASALEPYIPNMPTPVAEILAKGVADIKALELNAEFDTKATEIRTQALANANAMLATGLNGNVYAVNNLRRVGNKVASYLAVNVAENEYSSSSIFTDPNVQFTLTSSGNGGYTFYNDQTKTYIGGSLKPVEDEASAVKVYPKLNTCGYAGVAFPFAENKTGNGFNQDGNTGALTTYSIDDAGSIWALIECTDDAALEEAVNSVTTALEPYLPNVPAEVAAVLEAAIKEAKNLEYSAQVGTLADDIRTKAIADANEVLKTCFNGKYIKLKSLKFNEYVASVGNAFGAGETAATLKLTSAENGSYTIYSPEKSIYFGKDGQNTIYVSEIASAQSYYPQLLASSIGSGICFPSSSDFPTENAGLCLNTAWGNYFYDFTITGGNAPFGVFAVEYYEDYEKDVVAAAIKSVGNVLHPYIENVPTEVAAILESAIDGANALEYSQDVLSKANEISTKAIADANALLATSLNGKLFTLKNLRRANVDKDAYIAVNLTSDKYLPVASADDFNAQFTFNSVDNGGYTLYNPTTETYIGQKTSTTEKEGEDGETTTETTTWYGPVNYAGEAVKVYPTLNAFGDYCGVAFPFNADKTGPGFNEDDKYEGTLTGFNINDGGSIWALAEFDVQAAIDNVVNSVVKTALEPYIQNVPDEVAAILQEAIDDAAYNLEYNANIAANAEELCTNAIKDGTAKLKVALTNKNWALKNLRNGYVKANGSTDTFTVGGTDSAENDYDFMPTEDGGFILYSPSAKKYLGPGVAVGSETKMTLVSEQANAQKVYPVLNHNGNYYGISFPLTNASAAGTPGLNTNAGGMFSYRIGDDGSIFAVSLKANTVAIEEVENAVVGVEVVYDLQGRRVNGNAKGLLIVNGKKIYRK